MSNELLYISDILKVLQSPARQKIIVLLMNSESRSMTSLARLTGMNQGLAFQSLRQLENAGIVFKYRGPGRTIVYKVREINLGHIAAIYDNARMINHLAERGKKGGHHCDKHN